MEGELHHAKKVVIITEKVITEPICAIIEACGGAGYTISSAGGKGTRKVRSSSVSGFANVKIEALVNNRKVAETIMLTVSKEYFQNYSGITYLEDVEILRPEKFSAATH